MEFNLGRLHIPKRKHFLAFVLILLAGAFYVYQQNRPQPCTASITASQGSPLAIGCIDGDVDIGSKR